MATSVNAQKMYGTILAVPGMNEVLKIQMKISRKNILFLHQVIELGLQIRKEGKLDNIISNIPEENLEELKMVAADFLQKAGLEELEKNLKSW